MHNSKKNCKTAKIYYLRNSRSKIINCLQSKLIVGMIMAKIIIVKLIMTLISLIIVMTKISIKVIPLYNSQINIMRIKWFKRLFNYFKKCFKRINALVLEPMMSKFWEQNNGDKLRKRQRIRYVQYKYSIYYISHYTSELLKLLYYYNI